MNLIEKISNFLQSYCDCIDEQRYEEWCNFFIDSARYRVTTAENYSANYPIGLIDCMGKAMMQDRILGLLKANVFEPHTYRHILSFPIIKNQLDNKIFVKTSFLISRTKQGAGASLFVSGFYLDELVKIENELKIANRIAVLDSSLIDELIVLPI